MATASKAEKGIENNNFSKKVLPGGFNFSVKSRGLTSKKEIATVVHEALPGTGILFVAAKADGGTVEIPARSEFVVNTLRNVVIGREGTRLCIIEHLMAAATFWGLEDLVVEIDGPELPLGDGSAAIWLDALKKIGVAKRTVSAEITLKEPFVVSKGDRSITAIPDDKFSVTYLMDWNHPAIGKRWHTWTATDECEDISIARTFAPLKEHQLLGLENDVVSLTEDGFTMPLHFPDEPVRHKLLDLVGDLALIGFNPMKLKARFISIKGGHELDVELVKKLKQVIGDRA
jgi:UDP-3-O-[3-hydroxymyristoyl] N-acetylglucosamine deacetylase